MAMGWSEWSSKAAKLNPKVSQDTLKSIYNTQINPSTPPQINAAPSTPSFPKVNENILPLNSFGENTAYYQMPPLPRTPQEAKKQTQKILNNAINDINTTGEPLGERKKQQWMNDAAKLNPTVPQEQLSQIYDNTVVHPDQQKVSPVDQLTAITKMYQDLQKQAKEHSIPMAGTPENPYDASDKISMLGAALHTGGVGTLKGLLGVADLAEQLPEDFGLIKKGTGALMKQQQETFFNKDQLYKEAVANYPTTSAISEFVGSLLPLMPLAVEKGIGAGIKGLEWIAKGIPRIAKAMPIAEEGMAKLTDTGLNNGASKFLTKVVPHLLKYGGAGALYGAAQYDPTDESTTEKMITGALGNLLFTGGARLTGHFSPQVTAKVEELKNRYGITLPVFPRLNAFLSKIPLLGNGVSVAKGSKEYIGNLGRQLANKIISSSDAEAATRSQYSNFLHGELKTAYEANVEEATSKYNEIQEEANKLKADKKAQMNLGEVRSTATNLLNEENAADPVLQNSDLKRFLEGMGNIPNGDYATAQINRTRIGDELGGATGRAEGVYKLLYSKFSDAMDKYAEDAGSKIKQMHDEANEFYRENVVPFKYGKWRKFLAPDYDTDMFLKQFLMPDRPGNLQAILKTMPETDKALTAARAAIVHTALDNATIDPLGNINPEKFIKNVARLKETSNVLFTKEQQGMLDGYSELLQMTRKLAPAWLKETPQETSANIFRKGEVAGLGTYLGIAHPGLAIPLIGSGIGLIRLMTSRIGRDLLLGIAKKAGKIKTGERSELVRHAFHVVSSAIAPSAMQGL